MERTISFAGDPNIGVFCRVVGQTAIVPPGSHPDFIPRLSEALDLEVIETTIQGSHIIGSLASGNRRGLVVSGLATDREISRLEEYHEVMLLGQTMNAAGNILLVNDTFGAVHPDMPRSIRDEIASFLGISLTPLTLGGIKTVGMAGVASNRGVMVNPRSTRQEIARLEEIAAIPVGTGSVNMGSGLVGAGLLVSDHGYLAGTGSSGFELGRIEDVFGFLE